MEIKVRNSALNQCLERQISKKDFNRSEEWSVFVGYDVLRHSKALKRHIQTLLPILNAIIRNTMNFVIDFSSGISAGALSCFCGHFLDTVKVRMQMNPLLTSTASTLRHIVRNEGFRQLYKGIYYPLVITTASFSLFFSFYELYRTIRQKSTYTIVDGLENGAAVGLFFAAISTPVERVKCTMQNDSQNKYSSSRQCLKSILREGGIKGLYRGGTIMCLRQSIGYSAQFAVYQCMKGMYLKETKPHLTMFQAMTVGAVASVGGWLLSYPQDVIKTKLQVEPAGTYKNSKWARDGGIMECSKF